jgi:flagellar hook-associated protein 3 FlgL
MPRIESLPTVLLSHVPRQAIAASQAQLQEAQTEATTGRYHDVGLVLGAQTRMAILLRNDVAGLTASREQAEQASLWGDVTQSALAAVTDLAEEFRASLMGARNAERAQELAATAARSALGGFQSLMSTTHGGQYLFGGLNSGATPLVPYEQGPEQAVVAAFEAEFGFAPIDAAAQGISEGQIQAFIGGSLAALFTGTTWTSTWSNASDESPVLRVNTSEIVSVATNTNQPFAQALAMAFTMVEVLARARLSQPAFQAVTDAALQQASQAQLLTGAEQARIGIGEARLQDATVILEARNLHLTASLSALESVDAYEAATRVNALMTQLETSYALTGRLSRLSLLSYI